MHCWHRSAVQALYLGRRSAASHECRARSTARKLSTSHASPFKGDPSTPLSAGSAVADGCGLRCAPGRPSSTSSNTPPLPDLRVISAPPHALNLSLLGGQARGCDRRSRQDPWAAIHPCARSQCRTLCSPLCTGRTSTATLLPLQLYCCCGPQGGVLDPAASGCYAVDPSEVRPIGAPASPQQREPNGVNLCGRGSV